MSKLGGCLCCAIALVSLATPVKAQFHIPSRKPRPVAVEPPPPPPPPPVEAAAPVVARVDTVVVLKDSAEGGKYKILGTPAVIRDTVAKTAPKAPPTALALDLFGGVLTGVSADHAYVRTPIVQGVINNTHFGDVMFEFSYADVVGPKDTINGVSREDFQRRVSTIMRLINNGGAATARMIMLKSGKSLGGDVVGGAHVDLGVVDKSSSTGSKQRGTVGLAAESRVGWELKPVTGGTEGSAGLFEIGFRGGFHTVSGGHLADGMDASVAHFVQIIAQLHQGDKVLFGIAFTTALSKELRKYAPAVQFTLGAGPL